MSCEWRLYWQDIIACCEKIQRYTVGMDQSALMTNEMALDAVVRNIEIIGEASKSLPDVARALAPQIEWKKIAGTRDVLAHAYFGLDEDMIWDIVETKVPDLLQVMLKVKLP